jgi:hypothetical protein
VLHARHEAGHGRAGAQEGQHRVDAARRHKVLRHRDALLQVDDHVEPATGDEEALARAHDALERAHAPRARAAGAAPLPHARAEAARRRRRAAIGVAVGVAAVAAAAVAVAAAVVAAAPRGVVKV